MKSCHKIGLYLLSLLVIAGCASTKVTSRHEAAVGKLPRPNTIWVYDFAATPDDVPSTARLKLPNRSKSAGSWALKSRQSWSS